MRSQQIRCLLPLGCALLCLAAAAAAQTPFPSVTGETLAGQSITLPAASSGNLALLCIGFSHASQRSVTQWADTARQIPGITDSVYTIAVLQDAPRLVRGMIVRGMKTDTPPQKRNPFVVVYAGEASLKQAVHCADASTAYVALVDRSGRIRWIHSGNPSPAAVQELRDKVTELSTSPKAQ